MSARLDLEWQLALSGLEPAEAHRMLDAYAHELAEKIRTAPLGAHALQKHQLHQAADLIDPEVSNSDN